MEATAGNRFTKTKAALDSDCEILTCSTCNGPETGGKRVRLINVLEGTTGAGGLGGMGTINCGPGFGWYTDGSQSFTATEGIGARGETVAGTESIQGSGAEGSFRSGVEIGVVL
ncbi:MAG: hypothetical protein PVH19_02575 [Planctomycetia bacterium]